MIVRLGVFSKSNPSDCSGSLSDRHDQADHTQSQTIMKYSVASGLVNVTGLQYMCCEQDWSHYNERWDQMRRKLMRGSDISNEQLSRRGGVEITPFEVCEGGVPRI